MQNQESKNLDILFLGQACTKVTYGKISIVSDPWFSSRSHLNSWAPFPILAGEELEEGVKEINAATHIYLSHDHRDHFDPEFLAKLHPKTILVADFENQAFREALEKLKPLHHIRYVKDGEPIPLGDSAWARVFKERPFFRTNSVMLIETPQGRVLNANDCALNTELLSSISKHGAVGLFLYTLNFMANGYPLPYLRKDSPDFARRIQLLRNEIMGSFAMAMRVLKPWHCATFAGPVTFSHPANQHFNEIPEAKDWSKMIREMGLPIHWPAPFSKISLHDNILRDTSGIKAWDKYLTTPQPAFLEQKPQDVSQSDILTAAQALVENFQNFAQESQTSTLTKLIVSAVPTLHEAEGSKFLWSVELDFEKGAKFVGELGSPYLHLVTTPDLALQFLKGETNIDSFLLSCHARFSRVPDSFDPLLHNFLRFGLDPLSRKALIGELTKTKTSNETISVESNGKKFVIPKHCPHEGESFENACVENGLIVCSRHKWKFDLETGKCLAGDKRSNLYQDK